MYNKNVAGFKIWCKRMMGAVVAKTYKTIVIGVEII